MEEQRLDVASAGRSGASYADEQLSREEQLQQDHEMARQMHDRELEYARKRAEHLYPAAHDSYLDDERNPGLGGSAAEEQAREEQEKKDEEIAWEMQQKDFEYAYKRAERHREEKERMPEQESSDEEYPRRMDERPQTGAGRAAGSAYYDPDTYVVERPAVNHSEDSDAKLARQLYDKELAGVPGESRASYREQAQHHLTSQEESDAKLAREMYEREQAYVKSLNRDEMVAEAMQKYGQESERPRNGTYYDTAADMYGVKETIHHSHRGERC